MDNMDNMKQKDIKKKIKEAEKYIDTIDQKLHNEGINKLNRLDIIKSIIVNISNDDYNNDLLKLETFSFIKELLKEVLYIIPNSEISQQLFMFYGSKILKNSLDQFYTPISISTFMNSIVIKNKKYLDPAAGTGDLLISFTGDINLWEISKDAIEMATLNYSMNNKIMKINHTNSLMSDITNYYDYVIMNPPFGTKTVVKDKNVLNKFVLGKGRDKQEIGILFLELSLKLLKESGILMAILPGGYLGNSGNKYLRDYIIDNTRILSIIKLPSATFSRSGTGVSTYLIILKKATIKKDYNIHISEITEIGYELNKKNTPIKYKINSDGEYIIKDKNLVIENDFIELTKEIQKFSFDNNIDGLDSKDIPIEYDKCKLSDILNDKNLVMEVFRYTKTYRKLIHNLLENKNIPLHSFCVHDVDYSFKIDKNLEYTYVDISEINTPLYNGKKILGSQLPGRAKNKVKKNDIIISRLRGNISYTVILEDDIIVTNGVCVIRPLDINSVLIILSNLNSEDFKIQHQSLTTGSIMECISDTDIKNILINKDNDIVKYKKVYDSMLTLKELL